MNPVVEPSLGFALLRIAADRSMIVAPLTITGGMRPTGPWDGPVTIDLLA